MKDFILYKQALDLKELGFNEPCFGCWRSCLIPSNFTEFFLETEFGMNEIPSDWINSNFANGACSASLYQQAFRFFREKYGLYSWITMELGNKSTFCWVVSGEHTSTQYASYFHTYEEAELACLIKIIEIVKSNRYNDN